MDASTSNPLILLAAHCTMLGLRGLVVQVQRQQAVSIPLIDDQVLAG